MNNWQRFAQRDALDQALATHIAEALRADLRLRGAASLAVSGGSTPRGMFQCLCQQELDWAKVTVTLVDERWVPGDSPDSNERLLRENLLRERAAEARFVSLTTADANALEGLTEVRSRVAAIPQPFSMVILGMGGDGHTASWFPQAANLRELLSVENTDTVAATDPVTAPHQRITFTLAAVLNSREIIIHMTGDDKRDVMQAAPTQNYPVAAITGQQITPATIWWAP